MLAKFFIQQKKYGSAVHLFFTKEVDLDLTNYGTMVPFALYFVKLCDGSPSAPAVVPQRISQALCFKRVSNGKPDPKKDIPYQEALEVLQALQNYFSVNQEYTLFAQQNAETLIRCCKVLVETSPNDENLHLLTKIPLHYDRIVDKKSLLFPVFSRGLQEGQKGFF